MLTGNEAPQIQPENVHEDENYEGVAEIIFIDVALNESQMQEVHDAMSLGNADTTLDRMVGKGNWHYAN